MKTLKLVSALVIASSLAACGGGGSGKLPEPIELGNGTTFDGNVQTYIETDAGSAQVNCKDWNCKVIVQVPGADSLVVNAKIREVSDGVLLLEGEIKGVKFSVATDGKTYEYNVGKYDGNLDGKVKVDYQGVYDLAYLQSRSEGNTEYESSTTAAILTTHLQGFKGEGVNIAIVDNFQAPINSSYTHGSYIKKVLGMIAPDANIDEIDASSSKEEVLINKTKDQWYEADDYDVVNHSYGALGEYEADYTISKLKENEQSSKTAYKEYHNTHDVLHVVAAGNDSETCTTADKCNGTAIDYISLGFNTIVVGAIDDKGKTLENYSNAAGMLAEWYIAAPVADQCPGCDNSGYEGTSYAAPVVTGVAALIIDKFNTDAESTVDIIFSTADDLGAPGVDPIYGNGALNVKKALSPTGKLK